MSTIKVNTVETRTGSTLTLGKSGDTVSIASGASTSGMGRSGAVDWQTSIKTDSFTAVSGEGYFIDTSDGTPFKNYTTTVATGTLYLVGGSGNVFNLDGSQQTAITMLANKTYRFTQSDSSNDGHQLIISTSNSTTLGTFQAGIVSSGITYYIDGSATQSNWTNTTTFNAGTTRYIEYKPSTTGTYYFGCYNHGIGMGGAITVSQQTITLPSSPSVGAIVAIKDYASSFNTNNLVIGRNGSNLNGNAGDRSLSDNNISLTLVYADSTKGWLPVEEGTGFIGESFISASGGTETTCGNDKIHTFTSPGTFTVSSASSTSTNNEVSYIIVGGGGSGGATHGGGGGAGGYREVKSPLTPYTASPLDGYPSSPNIVTVSAQSYPIVVGGGGAAPANPVQPPYSGSSGSNSSFGGIIGAGGGRAGGGGSPGAGVAGGSGGGGANASPHAAGTGNTPPTTPAQGSNGGSGHPSGGTGGGGGATAVGTSSGSNTGGDGGSGATTNITGSPVAYAGGGGGGASAGTKGCGGAGGGANGKVTPCGVADSGTANTGGGGGGGGSSGAGGAGGSGIVIIRYKYQ